MISIKYKKIYDEFIKKYEEIHVNPWHEISKDELNDIYKKLVNKINELNPDIIIFTGDLISSNYKLTDNDKKSIIENLNKLDPKIDIYSIRGDNDINETYNSIITQTKIIEINNLNKLIYYKGDTPIMLIGLDDSINGNQSLDMAFNYEENNYQ